MKPRAWILVGGLGLAVLGLTVAGQPAYAQGLGQPTPPAGTGLNDLLANPGQWATAVFNAALVGLGERTTTDVVGFMGWLLGSGNVISQTPAGLSYDSQIVGRLWGSMRVVANAGLAVVTVWGGVNLMIRATNTLWGVVSSAPRVASGATKRARPSSEAAPQTIE